MDVPEVLPQLPVEGLGDAGLAVAALAAAHGGTGAHLDAVDGAD